MTFPIPDFGTSSAGTGWVCSMKPCFASFCFKLHPTFADSIPTCARFDEQLDMWVTTDVPDLISLREFRCSVRLWQNLAS